MSSRACRRLLLPRIGLFAIGVLLPVACAAGAPTIAYKPAAGAPAATALGTAATPATAALPSTSPTERILRSKSVASSTPTASTKPATDDSPAATDGSADTVYGFSAAELSYAPSTWQIQQLEAMKATGITSIRVDADWSVGQPDGPDSYSWTSLDQVVASIQKAGLSVDLVIDGCPAWAAVSGVQGDQFAQPASPAAFANWATAVVERYASKGAKYFEIWNEPNNPIFWQPSPNPAAYTADLKAAYAAIKAVDPSAIVISGGLAPEPDSSTSYSPLTFLEDMYADGAQGSFDGVGFHPYTYPLDPDTVGSVTAWTQMSETNPSIRSIMAANNDSDKKIWITEFGAPTSGTDANVSESEQSTELEEAISQVKQLSWIGSFYMYTWEDVTGEGFGLLTIDGVKKLAYAAVVADLPR